MKSQIRELMHDLSAQKLTKEADGSLIIKGAILLAAGTWTPSNTATPITYSEEVLKKYAGNWVDSPLWSRHGGGIPRSITDKIGDIKNQRYNEGKVLGDLTLHGKTQTSRDTIEMIIAGAANAVSVEHIGKETWNPKTNTYDAKELTFYGAAAVSASACTICTINNEASRLMEEQTMEVKELEEKLASAEGTIKELSEASATKDTELKELSTKLVEIGEKFAELEGKIPDFDKSKELTELEGRIEKMEKTPIPGQTQVPTDDLGTVNLSAIVYDNEGITRRVF